MVRALLMDRFKLAVHMGGPAHQCVHFALRKTETDESGSIESYEMRGRVLADGKDPRDKNPALNRLLTCQNLTMTQFSEMLQGLASGYTFVPVKDSTGLEGGWDFTLSFSTAGTYQNAGRGAAAPAAGGAAMASDPSGALSLPEAVNKQLGLKLEKQMRPVPVLVIDHVEEKPTDN